MKPSRARPISREHPGKAWLAWCEQHADELPLPIRRSWSHGGSTELRLSGAHPNLRFRANELGIYVDLHWLGEFAGFLVELEYIPKRDADGRWYCEWCDEAERSTFDTLHDLWVDHLFIPWLEKMRELFQPDVWVVYSQEDDCASAEILAGRRLIEKLKGGKYLSAFRVCVNPQLLNPSCTGPAAKRRERIGGFMMLGPSVTGLNAG